MLLPSTCWSRLLADPAAGSVAARRAFETLAQSYSRPIVAYVRARGARSDEDAREEAQEFFLWMIESGFLGRADPSRGRFRGFLKRCLANFLHDRKREQRTVKRGGGRSPLRLEDENDQLREIPDPAARSAEELLDDLWRQELLSSAADSLEKELHALGKERTFLVFRDYFLGDEDLDYGHLAERHGISKVDVSNELTAAKKRYRAYLRQAVLETVQDAQELRAEFQWLLDEAGP